MQGIHVFIISWTGQHENAASIAGMVQRVADKVTIVYSDPNQNLTLDAACAQVRRPNDLFWGDKFRACLDTFDSELMLVIHADCKCEDWPDLVQKCRATMEANATIGVWAPQIQGANMDIRITHIASIDATPLLVVAQTDAIVFALSKPVVARMQLSNYERNIFGWGIDDMASAFCFSRGMLVVVDRSLLVEHPVSCGYSKKVAESQKAEFLKQLTFIEAIQHRLLWSCINLNYSRIMAQVK